MHPDPRFDDRQVVGSFAIPNWTLIPGHPGFCGHKKKEENQLFNIPSKELNGYSKACRFFQAHLVDVDEASSETCVTKSHSQPPAQKQRAYVLIVRSSQLIPNPNLQSAILALGVTPRVRVRRSNPKRCGYFGPNSPVEKKTQ